MTTLALMYSTQKLVKSAKNSTWPYLNEISPHFIHEIKTKGYDDIGINIFLRTLMRFLRKKRSNPGVTGPYTTTGTLSSASSLNTFRKYWIWCTPSHTFQSHYCMTLEELSLTGSHCKSLSIGEISSNFLVLLTIRAAKFCIAWISCIGQIEVSTCPPPPGQTPGIWLFWNFLFKFPQPGPRCRSNAPH